MIRRVGWLFIAIAAIFCRVARAADATPRSVSIVVVDTTGDDPDLAASKQKCFPVAAALERLIAGDSQFKPRDSGKTAPLISSARLALSLEPDQIATRRDIAGS